jgi:hypothetical protein
MFGGLYFGQGNFGAGVLNPPPYTPTVTKAGFFGAGDQVYDRELLNQEIKERHERLHPLITGESSTVLPIGEVNAVGVTFKRTYLCSGLSSQSTGESAAIGLQKRYFNSSGSVYYSTGITDSKAVLNTEPVDEEALLLL